MIGLGIYAVIGLYAMAFNTADLAVSNSSQAQAFHDQARVIANVGVKFAIGDAGAATSPTLSSSTVSLMGGSVTYVTDRPAGVASNQMRVTSTSSYTVASVTYSVTMVAILYYNGAKWTMQRIYQTPDATEYSRLS
ncbi:MAG TPA: hypothetical protein VMG34_00830 [Bacteroidota bacterium]|nr:hypothetical protein [Bacteroidota bacterium]